MAKIDPDFCLRVNEEITLELPSIKDAEEIFHLVDKNRAYLREFLGWVDASVGVADTRRFLEENLPLWLDLSSLHLSIRKGGMLVGAVGLHQVDFVNHSAFMGYWLDQDHQGQGIMTKSVQRLIDYGVEKLKFHRLQLLCALHNRRSQRLALRLGFQQEGVLKEAIAHSGEYFDAYLYGRVFKEPNL